jgi:hypothetical protein
MDILLISFEKVNLNRLMMMILLIFTREDGEVYISALKLIILRKFQLNFGYLTLSIILLEIIQNADDAGEVNFIFDDHATYGYTLNIL